MAFPQIAHHIRGLPFVIFAVMMAVRLVVVFLFVPKTQRRSLESIGAAV